AWLIKPERRDRLKVRQSSELANAVLATTHPDMFTDSERRAFQALAKRCLLHRFGGDCYNYAMPAPRFVGLVVESQLKPFDIVPLIPILEGAGAVVTDWQGKRPMTGGAVVAAATAELHAAVLELLASAASG